jgi:primosomal protein N' (replication factor Y) (superfamily II helicase)
LPETAHVVDVSAHLRTGSFDQPLTYLVPAEMPVGIGDVVRVPLGSRDAYGYVVSPMRSASEETRSLRSIAELLQTPRAFDASGLHLAEWTARQYCCSLREALSAATYAGAIPRVLEGFTLTGNRPEGARFSSVPQRLIALIWEDLREGFALDALLRHPEARRAGDRATLLRAVGALARAGLIKRVRTFAAASMKEAEEKMLEATGVPIRGKRVAELIARVMEEGALRRRDAVLEGFSSAIIARALREGGLRETRRPAQRRRSEVGRERQEFTATSEQRAAIDAIVASVAAERFSEMLLDGVTGSGKTFVYIEAIRAAIARGGRAIVLVPEIALTPQTARRFETAFPRTAVLHSGLSERERFDGRAAAARGEIDVVVGARSAVFAPLPDVRLIVIDEAHEGAYKQESAPRYHTAAVARERMRRAGGVLVLGSATPPLESYVAALRGEVAHVRLRRRATAQALAPMHVVNMSEEFESGNRRIFSTRLVEGMSARLKRSEKIVLFLNRRGSAGFMLCRACGAVPECERCSLSLTVHRAEGLLRCHLCDARAEIPSTCPRCRASAIREFGAGTQKAAEAVQALFPEANVVRMDADSTTRVGDHARLLDAFARGGDVLVGTQMVAKGLDFPTVTLVGIVAADIGLHFPDFRASERTFGLLTQAAGRSGRASPGEAIVQTYSPEHPAIRFAAAYDYEGFARQELEERRALRYPPFGRLVYLGIIGRRREDAQARADVYAQLMRALPGVEVLGPAPFSVARMNDEWRYRIAVKTPELGMVCVFIRETLQKIAAKDRLTRLLVNVDP